MPTAPSRRVRGGTAVALACAALLAACSKGVGVARPVPPAEAVPAAGASGLSRADALLRSGDVDGALRLYEEEIERAPASVRVHLRYVSAALAEARDGEARALYRRRTGLDHATDADRTMAARLATDGTPAAVREVYAAAANASPNEPWWRLALAELDLAEAHRRIEGAEAARLSGDRGEVEEARAAAEGALARAEESLARVEELDAALPETALYRGVLLVLRTDFGPEAERKAGYRAAAEPFRRATRADPALLEAWAGLADALARTDDDAEALAAWREALRLSPRDADLRDGAALALHELERHAEAAAELEVSARLRPKDPRPLLDAGEEYAAACLWPQALDAYARALERDPKAAEAHARRGAALERLSRPTEAREAYAAYLAVGGPRTDEMRRRLDRLARAGAR
jgi:tetratricopeptide (TPR) repeat protein